MIVYIYIYYCMYQYSWSCRDNTLATPSWLLPVPDWCAFENGCVENCGSWSECSGRIRFLSWVRTRSESVSILPLKPIILYSIFDYQTFNQNIVFENFLLTIFWIGPGFFSWPDPYFYGGFGSGSSVNELEKEEQWIVLWLISRHSPWLNRSSLRKAAKKFFFSGSTIKALIDWT